MTELELEIPADARAGVVAVGNFDGVHLGHQEMLSRIRQQANRRNAASVVLTFNPHPITVLRPEIKLPRLTTIPDRVRLLKQHGATHVVVLPATNQLLQMSPQHFFEEVIVKQLSAVAMIEGPDFRFGKNREGDTDLLGQLCRFHGIDLSIIECFKTGGVQVSSTRLRSAIAEGEMRLAYELLGRAYAICGTVVAGKSRGRTLGFPTANLAEIPMLIPADGVYAGAIQLSGDSYPVAVNIGPNPTFQEAERKVECHILDFRGDLYGQQLSIDIRHRIRGLTQFRDAAELVQQIQSDISQTRDIFTDSSSGAN